MARNTTFDIIKILATIQVLLFHAMGPKVLANFVWEIGAFVAIMITLQAHGKERSWPEFAKSKWKRLVVPWLFWGVMGVIAEFAYTKLQGQPMSVATEKFHPVYFSQIHLWFAPFALAALTAIKLLKPMFEQPASPAKISGLLLLASVTFIAPHLSDVYYTKNYPEPLPQMIQASSGMFFYFAIAQGFRPGEPRRPGLILATIAVFAGCAWYLWFRDKPWAPRVPVVTSCYGMVILPLALLLPRVPAGKAVDALIALSWGIILSHPLVSRTMSMIPGFDSSSGLHAVFILGPVTAVMVALIRKTPLRIFT